MYGYICNKKKQFHAVITGLSFIFEEGKMRLVGHGEYYARLEAVKMRFSKQNQD